MEFNINDAVKIRLRPSGIEIYRAYYANTARILERPIEPTVGADGWTSMQLWMVMAIFGRHIHMTGDPPFETTIQIDDMRSGLAVDPQKPTAGYKYEPLL